jgi:hypothetical protein
MPPLPKATIVVPLLATLLAGAVYRQRPPRPQAEAQARPSSFALIDTALAAKRIDTETAYLYRVFAAFGDTRLPAAFRGDDKDVGEVPRVVTEAGALLPTFSAKTRADLAPFFQRPDAPGSWAELGTAGGDADVDAEGSGSLEVGSAAEPVAEPDRSRSPRARRAAIQWFAVSAAGGKVKVWAELRYAGDSVKAEQIAQAVTSTIWPRLTGLFWAPKSDGGLTPNGGGPALDIYLVRPNATWLGHSENADPRHPCSESPQYLLLNSRAPLGGPSSPGLLQNVAHEMTHAITHTKKWLNDNCWEFAWFDEATAEWSEDWVYPRANSEQLSAWRFLGFPKVSLDHYDVDDKHQYGAYLLPYYLATQHNPIVIPAIWEQFATHASLDGIDAALRFDGLKLKDEFPKFAVRNLNRPPVDDYFRLDRLTDVAMFSFDSMDVKIPPTGHFEKDIFMGMKYLSTKYARFVFDPSVKSVTFENTLTPIPYAGVWGVEKIHGQWKQPADWTATRGKSWCRNAVVEDLEQLILVFTNNQWQNKALTVDPGPQRPLLRAFPTGCSAWEGTVTARFTTNIDPFGTLTETAAVTARFQPDSDFVHPGKPVIYWGVVSGAVRWTAVATGGVCTGSFAGTMPLLPGIQDGSKMATLAIQDEGKGLRYTVSLGPWPTRYDPVLTWTCRGQGPLTTRLVAANLWWEVAPEGMLVSPDGKTLHDTWALNLGVGTIHWDWTFRFQ